MMENQLFKNEKAWEKFIYNIANWKYIGVTMEITIKLKRISIY